MRHRQVLLGAALGLLAATAAADDFTLVEEEVLSAGASARGARLIDVDGDGWLDLATLGETQGTLNVMRNLGAALAADDAFRFGEREVYRVGEQPTEIGIGDLDGDGDDDLVVAVREDDLLVVFLAEDGRLVEATRLETGEGPYDVIVHDIDGDGDNDIVVGERVDDHISIFLSDGDGHGYARHRFSSVPETRQITLGDFNNDGIADIAVAGSRLQIHHNDGEGRFSRGQSLDLDGQLQNVVAGDFDLDGRTDLLVTRVETRSVHILLADSSGRFTDDEETGRHQTFNADYVPNVVTAADLDQDGKLDIAIGGRSGTRVTMLYGTGQGGFRARQLLADASPVSSMAVGDMDRDGRNDLVLTHHVEGVAALYRGHAEQPYDEKIELSLGGMNGSMILDMEDGQTARVLVSDTQRRQVHVLNVTARDAAVVAQTPVTIVPSLLRSRALADGSREVFFAANAGSDIGRFRLSDASNIQPLPGITVGEGFAAWLPGSFSAPGERELLIVTQDGDLLLKQLDDSGDVDLGITGGEAAAIWEAADLDGDGMDEVIAVTESVNVISLEGATMLADSELALPAVPDRVRVLDADGDGDKDLLLVYGSARRVDLHLNDGGALASEALVIPVNGTPDDVAVPDLDGDGVPDLAIADIAANRVELRLRQGGQYVFVNYLGDGEMQPRELLSLGSVSPVSPLLVNHGEAGVLELHRRSDNRRPVAEDLDLETRDDKILIDHLLASDPDGDYLEYVVLLPPEQGEFELLDPLTGRFRYVPEKGFDGEVHVNYVAVDDMTTSEVAVVKITVNKKGGGGSAGFLLLLLASLLPLRAAFRK